MEKRTSWLAYSKIILEKVSFDPKIFRKELRKSLVRLSREEINKLQGWCEENLRPILTYIAVSEISDYLSIDQ